MPPDWNHLSDDLQLALTRAALRLFTPMLPARFVEHGRREMGWLADGVPGSIEAETLRGGL